MAEQTVGSVGKGMLVLLAWHLLQVPAAAATVGIALLLIFLTQLLYGVPLVLRYRRRGELATAKGVLIGMGLTALLNTTCSVVTMGNMSFH